MISLNAIALTRRNINTHLWTWNKFLFQIFPIFHFVEMKYVFIQQLPIFYFLDLKSFSFLIFLQLTKRHFPRSRHEIPYSFLRDDTHITSMKIVQFQTNPCPPPNDSQSITRKHNPRLAIISYQVVPSGRLSFSASTH